ncbi:MAG: DsrE family protein [Bacteroidota bacterium]
MKKLFLLTVFISLSALSFAQQKMKLVFDLSSEDTLSHAAVYRQINNVLVDIPDLQVEVVLHGQAVRYMLKDSSYFNSRVAVAKSKGVTLAVCNNSLRRLKIDPSQVKSEAIVVPSAVGELVRKQHDGWAYIKAGH